MKYLTPEQVLFIHARIIAATGGTYGVRDIGMLQSAVGRPQASFECKELYPDLYAKAGALMHSLTQNHPFLDGNMRTALTTAVLFLRLNDHTFTASNAEVENYTLRVAQGEKEPDQIATWLRKHARPRS